MNAVINLGNPAKDMTLVADNVLGRYSEQRLKLTGVRVYQGDGLLVTSPAYGSGMILDALKEMNQEEMNQGPLIGDKDSVIFVGSMGSLNLKIKLGDIVLPNPCGCAYYGFDGVWLEQDAALLKALKVALTNRDKVPIEYRHGSSFAVYDPHTDHEKYTSSLYDSDVLGVDCGEVFLGIQFAQAKGMKAAAALFCSDSPKDPIAGISETEFEKRAAESDLLLNKIAAQILMTS